MSLVTLLSQAMKEFSSWISHPIKGTSSSQSLTRTHQNGISTTSSCLMTNQTRNQLNTTALAAQSTQLLSRTMVHSRKFTLELMYGKIELMDGTIQNARKQCGVAKSTDSLMSRMMTLTATHSMLTQE